MSDAAAPPRLDDMLCFAVHAASRAITKAYRPALEAALRFRWAVLAGK